MIRRSRSLIVATAGLVLTQVGCTQLRQDDQLSLLRAEIAGLRDLVTRRQAEREAAGRYRLEIRRGGSIDTIYLLDTATGQVWQEVMSKEGPFWNPIPIAKETVQTRIGQLPR